MHRANHTRARLWLSSNMVFIFITLEKREGIFVLLEKWLYLDKREIKDASECEIDFCPLILFQKILFFARSTGKFLIRRTQFRPTRAVAVCVSKGLVFPLQMYWNIDAKSSGSSENQFSAPLVGLTWIYLTQNSPPPWTLRPCSKRAVSFSIKAAEQRNCLSPTLFPRGGWKLQRFYLGSRWILRPRVTTPARNITQAHRRVHQGRHYY